MIEWSEAANDREGLRIYRVDAEAGGIPGSWANEARVSNPLALILAHFDIPNALWLHDSFTGTAAAVGENSFSVAERSLSRIEDALDQARESHGHLEFRSRGRNQPAQGETT